MATRSFSITVIRPEDLLLLRLEFVDVETGVPGELGGGPPARLLVHFQPQHVAEQAFFETPPEPLRMPGELDSRMAGASRLVFRIPAGERIPLTLPDVLESLKRLPLVVPPVAGYEPSAGCFLPSALLRLIFGQPAPPKIAVPSRGETAIEAPYRLFLSPDAQGSWDHAAEAVDHAGRVELWHTRLGSRRASRDPRVRAVWSPDFQTPVQPHADAPFRMSLDPRDRNQIVQSTSNFHIEGFTPEPVETKRLMLTALGAWIDVHGQWTPPTGLSLEEWRHVATMGRDHFVRVVEAGYLLPFGHRASLVKITERKFVRPNAEFPGFVAYDLQREFIIVRERSRNYATRDLPFVNVEILTRVTPDLFQPKESIAPDAFWPQVSVDGVRTDFQFQLAAIDREGRRVEFTAPLVFVDKIVEETAAQRTAVLTAYNNPATEETPRRERPFGGQSVAFAIPKNAGDTSLEAKTISFGVADAGTPDARTAPHFRPTMVQARADIPAVKQLTNSSAASRIRWEPTYLTGPGTAIGNAANLYARVVDEPEMKFAAQQSGGLVTPDLSITGLSRSLGPVGGKVDDLVKPTGKFIPAEIFGKIPSPPAPPSPAFPYIELLGGIALSSIIHELEFTNAASANGAVPQLRTLRSANAITTTYRWALTRTELIKSDLFIPEDDATLVLEAEVEKRLDSTDPPKFRTKGTLTNFGVLILPKPAQFAQIDFTEVTFTQEPGKKLDTDVKLKGFKFLGILQFVDKLREVIPMDGFSDPPALEVGPDGVRVGFSVGIPTVGVGIMTMQNLSLSAGFFLPFTKEPVNFRFAFCERHQPFILTVLCFGGGGFVAINLGPEGVKSLEAALEFGASIALNLGVASGSATIMAGFYFQMKVDEGFELTGYFRACGELSVLGIISVCLEFYLGLTYTSKGFPGPHPGKLWGQARLTVKIKILFFSMSVGISMEKVFAGSDPTFRDMLLPPDWLRYCDSFADYPMVGE